MSSSLWLAPGVAGQPATSGLSRLAAPLCFATGLICTALVAGVVQGMPAEHFIAIASSSTSFTVRHTTAHEMYPRQQGVVAQLPASVLGLSAEMYSTGSEPASQDSTSPITSTGLKVVAVLSGAMALALGFFLGRHQQRPLPMVMAAVGDGDNRSEWDKRTSVMDQATPGTRYVSEADFGSLLVQFVQQRFGVEETKRIVDSFHRTERGEEFRKRFGPHPFMEQVAASYIAGLTTKPDWPDPAKHYPWASVVQQGWQTIRAELEEAIRLGDEGLRAKGSISWMGAQGGADSYGTEWKTLGLCDRGYWDDDNTRIFKNTCRILRKARAPIMECFFAKMPAHTAIQPHSDYTNFVLTCHLGLKTPPKSHILCGDVRHEWRDGEMFLLDTTFLHEAVNESDEDRYVLIMRVWHPELTAIEIEAITFLFDCLDDSEIILHPDGLAMYDMMKAHRIMEWNAILGPGDTEEESQQILRKIAEGKMSGEAIEDASKLSAMVKEKLKE